MSGKLRPHLRSIYRTLVLWLSEAFGLLLLIHFIPGLSVNSVYDPTNDEVAAFEELIGSHGGLGGTQCKPFVLYPANRSWARKNYISCLKVNCTLCEQNRRPVTHSVGDETTEIHRHRYNSPYFPAISLNASAT